MPRDSYRRSYSRSRSRSRSPYNATVTRHSYRDDKYDDRNKYRNERQDSRDRDRDRGRDRDFNEVDQFRIHIADLAESVQQTDIEKAFSKFGEIKEVWMARNPPCFAFVVFLNKDDAAEAVKQMDDKILGGTHIRVTHARPRTIGRHRRFDPGMKCYQVNHSKIKSTFFSKKLLFVLSLIKVWTQRPLCT
jgi:splicing factor, arginine/serine-rich 7